MSSAGREKKRAGRDSKTVGLAGKLGKNKMEIAAILAALGIVAIVLFPFYLPTGGEPPDGPSGGTDGGGQATPAPAEIAPCVTDNPDLSQEQCWDLYYNDMALKEGDVGKCALIKNAGMRRNCERYF